MANLAGVPKQELLAREFESWQKTFYDDVYAFYEKGNEARGQLALTSWENRFVSFLAERAPSKFGEYTSQILRKGRVKYFGPTVLQNFNSWKGDIIRAFLEQCIADARRGYLTDDSLSNIGIEESSDRKGLHTKPRIFLSHSSSDVKLAQLLVELLRSALDLRADDIRCTSVDGYRLPGGVETNPQLRQEIRNAVIMIGLITSDSLESDYVKAELGARWETEGTLIPLLARGTSAADLKGPLAGYNALYCRNAAELHQLVVDVSTQLGEEREGPNVYQGKIEEIAALG